MNKDAGQGLVEFAIVLPVLVLVVLALFDLGRGVIAYSELANASRVGARVAIVNQSTSTSCVGPDTTARCAAADAAVTIGLSPSDVDLDVSSSDCPVPSACTATVQVTHTFELVTPIISAIVSEILSSASTTMSLERNYP